MESLERQNDIQQSLIAKAVVATAVYSVFYSIFGGVARYGLAQVHALFLNGIPTVLTLLLFGATYIQALAKRRINRFMPILLLFVVFYFIYSLMMLPLVLQAFMGFYIWSAFLLGVLVCFYEKEETLFKFMIVFWGISVFGVFLNYFVDYPWIGQSYEAAGTTMEVARSWDAEGVKRLPGFSRQSFAAASQILLCGSYLLSSRKYSFSLKTIIYLLSGLALFLTTSKTELALLAVLPLVLLVYKGAKTFSSRTNIAFYYARAVIVLMVCLTVMMPLALSTHKQIKMTGPLVGFITADTLIDRITNMWPEAFDILQAKGNLVFGSGIGSIGTGLAIRDPKPETVNAGDNLFVYVLVEGGAFLAVPFFIAFFIGLGPLYRKNVGYFESILGMSFCVLGISIMAASIEDPVISLLLGILVARGYMPLRESKTEALPAA